MRRRRKRRRRRRRNPNRETPTMGNSFVISGIGTRITGTKNLSSWLHKSQFLLCTGGSCLLATWEAEIRRITVANRSRQIVGENLS
jgi:hypothetical protein